MQYKVGWRDCKWFVPLLLLTGIYTAFGANSPEMEEDYTTEESGLVLGRISEAILPMMLLQKKPILSQSVFASQWPHPVRGTQDRLAYSPSPSQPLIPIPLSFTSLVNMGWGHLSDFQWVGCVLLTNVRPQWGWGGAGQKCYSQVAEDVSPGWPKAIISH